MKKEVKTIEFGYANLDMELLEWEVGDMAAKPANLNWDQKFELTVDNDISEDYSVMIIDSAFYLNDKKGDNALYIKTRSRFSITHAENNEYEDGVVTYMLDKAISNTRGICADKALEEEWEIPYIPFITYKRLYNIASLMVFKPSINDFSYEQKITNTIIAVPEAGIRITMKNSIVNWYRILKKEHDGYSVPDFETGDDEEEDETARMVSDFDFEVMAGGKWEIYIDISIIMNYKAQIHVRTGFVVEGKEEEIFQSVAVNKMVEIALGETFGHYMRICREYKIEAFDEVPVLSPELINGLAEMIINQSESRISDNEANEDLLEKYVTLSKGGNTLLVVKTTFIILDEILFVNPLFSHQHNQEALVKYAMLHTCKYYTLKHKLYSLESSGSVELTLLDSCFYNICIDMAIQLLLNDQGDLLQPALNRNNLSKIRQEEYIRFGGEFVNQMNNSLKRDEAEISLLKERIDWVEIIS